MTISPDDLALTAMCLWEEYLTNRNDPEFHAALEVVGTAQLREDVLALAEPCHDAWERAQAEGYDDCFDWRWCPDWLTHNVSWVDCKPTT